jgi:hypothetical protein
LPGSRLPLSGIRIPFWEEILLLAVRSAQAIGLNYAGVDIAIDREDGPMVLEINARPGLDIQFANSAPLKNRLRRVEGLKTKSIERKIALAKSLFSGDIEQDITDVSGRTVLGIDEEIKIIDSTGTPQTFRAKIDTGAWRTTIDTAAAEKLGIATPVLKEIGVKAAMGREMRPLIAAHLEIKNHPIKTEITLTDRDHMDFPVLIGRRDLKGFLVDPCKSSPKK